MILELMTRSIELFREFKAVEDVIKTSEEQDERVELDRDIDWPNWQKYEQTARSALAKYNTQLRVSRYKFRRKEWQFLMKYLVKNLLMIIRFFGMGIEI